MPKRIPPVTLSESEQQTLQALVNQGHQSARQIKRAQILLHSHAGKPPKEIAAWLGTSLATVYNTLHQFQEAGLLREVAVDASRSYFDTDTSDHHHFYIEDEQRVVDIPTSSIVIKGLPEPPAGMVVTHVDVVVRVKKQA